MEEDLRPSRRSALMDFGLFRQWVSFGLVLLGRKTCCRGLGRNRRTRGSLPIAKVTSAVVLSRRRLTNIYIYVCVFDAKGQYTYVWQQRASIALMLLSIRRFFTQEPQQYLHVFAICMRPDAS